jgi:tetratricopeptide (TPR) repeat protein
MDDSTRFGDLGSGLEQAIATARELTAGFRPKGDGSEGARLVEVQRRLTAIAENVKQLGELVDELGARADRAAAERRERVRFTPEGVEATLAQVERLAERRWKRAIALLLSEVAAALSSLQKAAAARLLAAAPGSFSLSHLGELLSRWAAQDDLVAGRDAAEALIEIGRKYHIPVEAARQLALVVAWLNHRLGEVERAIAVLDRECREEPGSAVAHAELAGLLLTVGQVERATELARRAVDLDPKDGFANLLLGTASEARAEYRDAIELYRAGFGCFDRPALVRLGTGTTFLSATGLMDFARAERLADLGDSATALDAIEKALGEGIAGELDYPEAAAWELRVRLLTDQRASPEAVARAAFEAGWRHLWNRDDRAVSMLRIAAEEGTTVPDAGWYLTSALWMAASSQTGELDLDRAREALSVWDGWRDRIGAPSPSAAWSYPLRAVIADNIAMATGADSASTAWDGVLLCERALVLDRFDAFAYGTCATFFRRFTLDRLAFQCADAGFAADPDQDAVLSERVALLSNAGRFDEALEMIARISAAATDPWYNALRGWVLLNRNKPADALPYLGQALSGWERGWALEVRVECYVALKRLDDAIDDLRQILVIDPGQNAEIRLRHAGALLIVQGPDEAAAELAAIRGDETVTRSGLATLEASLALVEGSTHDALARFECALDSSPNYVEARGAIRSLRTTVALLRHMKRAVPGAETVLEAAEERLGEWSPPPLPETHEELAAAIAQHMDDPPASRARVALAATRSRLLRGDGDLAEAAAEYDKLRDGPFEPEATRALGDALTEQMVEAIKKGDAEQTAFLFDLLQELGRAPASFVEISVADALIAAQQTAEAAAQLRAIAPRAVSAADRLAVYERLGNCAFREGDMEIADESYSKAAAAAIELDDRLRAAQLEVRLGVASGLGGSLTAAIGHFEQAASHWTAAGTIDPAAVLVHEIGWLLDSVGPKTSSLLTEQVLQAGKALAARWSSSSGDVR